MIKVIRERHETPRFVSEALRIAGGMNRFGEPNFRAVWGANRLDWIGGKWEDRNEAGELVRERIELRRVPKYAVDRWHIERWLAPESYGSPRMWAMQTMEREDGKAIAALGPYPSRGDYELVMTLEGPRGEFLQLTPTVAERIARLVSLSSNFSQAESMAALRRRAAKEESDYDKFAWDVLSDTPQYPGMHVSVA